MKFILQIILLCLGLQCLAQPTGHQKIFLEITDGVDTLNLKGYYKLHKYGRKTNLNYKKYQLLDVSKNPTGFEYYPDRGYIHKTLMTNDHEIVIVKNNTDTMRIQLINAFNVYFLSIPFQKGSFRMIVNDGHENKWPVNTLPYKKLNNEQIVYDLTPTDWSPFRVSKGIVSPNYSVETQFRKQGLLVEPVLPENDPNFRNPRRINTLSVETADYNFDGQKDYREQKWENNKEWNYFIYADSTKGYVLDTLLSSMIIVAFNFEQKTFNVQNGKSNNAGIETYQFINGQPSIVPQDKANVSGNNEKPKTIVKERVRSIRTYEVNPFRFELERNIPDVKLPSIEYYANKISVYNQTGMKLIYTMVAVGNETKESSGCNDSLQIADYNFDGSPDFRVCSNSMPGKHTYYIYHQQRQTFIIEQSLSELTGLSFDFQNKVAIGYTGKKQAVNHATDSSKQFYTEQLHFEGNSLQNLTVNTTLEPSMIVTTAKCMYIKQRRICEGDSIGLKLSNKKPLVKQVNQFKFELVFNPEEAKTSGEKGSYVSHLTVYYDNNKSGPYEIHGNYYHEVPHWQDSLEIADYNFDGYPDIRLYKSNSADGSYSYMLFNPEKEIQQYYVDGLFSSSIETEFIPNQKIWKGKIVESNLTRYLFLRNDTLTITIQEHDLTKPPFIEESIYKNGNRTTIRSAYNTLEPVVKREYGDYNFDGYEDLRQQSNKSPYYWDVFIYNPNKESFEKDILLSKFEIFEYDKLDKKLLGSFRIRPDETTSLTKYYQWSFTEKKMLLYQEKTCYSKYPMSESQRCTVSRLVDGKWIETETYGAE
jgi:hypothetical protein